MDQRRPLNEKMQWKEAGWNGVRFETPLTWEPSEIGRRYLLFEDQGQPVLELKWGKINGRFNPDQVMGKLTPVRRRRRPDAFDQWSPPSPLQKALAAYQFHGFSWKTPHISAKGLLLYCPLCKTATLIQFLERSDAAHGDGQVTAHILRSFRDHDKDGRRLWAVYDISALVPEIFVLADYHFHPGHFTLHFKQDRKWLSLQRWSPAGVILGRQSLETFATGRMASAERGHKMQIRTRENTVDGALSPEATAMPGLGWIGRRLKRNRYQLWRVWHVKASNRILAVSLQDTHAIDKRWFDQMVSSYGAVL